MSKRSRTASRTASRFASTAVPAMVEALVRRGAVPRRLIAKVAGAAQMFQYERRTESETVGARNLKATLDALSCHTMRVKEWQGEVVFLHEVGQGEAEASYGIHVGRLAGLPDAVVERAREVLGRLESGERSGDVASLASDLPLLSAAPAAAPAKPSIVEETLAGVSPDELTPREALDLVYRLKRMLDE